MISNINLKKLHNIKVSRISFKRISLAKKKRTEKKHNFHIVELNCSSAAPKFKCKYTNTYIYYIYVIYSTHFLCAKQSLVILKINEKNIVLYTYLKLYMIINKLINVYNLCALYYLLIIIFLTSIYIFYIYIYFCKYY